jgi:hypothetical protein
MERLSRSARNGISQRGMILARPRAVTAVSASHGCLTVPTV